MYCSDQLSDVANQTGIVNFELSMQKINTFQFVAMIVAQMAGQLLLKPEGRDSKPVIGKFNGTIM